MPKRKSRRKPINHGPRVVLNAEDQVVLARSIRRSCDECGSLHIHWGDVAGGVWGARTDGQRAAFTEAVSEGLSTEWAAWWCMDCDALGIFRPLQTAW